MTPENIQFNSPNIVHHHPLSTLNKYIHHHIPIVFHSPLTISLDFPYSNPSFCWFTIFLNDFRAISRLRLPFTTDDVPINFRIFPMIFLFFPIQSSMSGGKPRASGCFDLKKTSDVAGERTRNTPLTSPKNEIR